MLRCPDVFPSIILLIVKVKVYCESSTDITTPRLTSGKQTFSKDPHFDPGSPDLHMSVTQDNA